MEEALQRGIKEENKPEKRLEQGEKGMREDQTAKWDGAMRAFKTKMRHLNQPAEMSKKEKQWQV